MVSRAKSSVDRAAVLEGWAVAKHDSSGRPRPPLDRDTIDAAHVAMSSAIGQSHYESLKTQGADMSREAVFAAATELSTILRDKISAERAADAQQPLRP